MPYEVKESDACPASKPWGVFKQGETSDPLGCHATEEKANGQMAAINIAEHERASSVEEWEAAMAYVVEAASEGPPGD